MNVRGDVKHLVSEKGHFEVRQKAHFGTFRQSKCRCKDQTKKSAELYSIIEWTLIDTSKDKIEPQEPRELLRRFKKKNSKNRSFWKCHNNRNVEKKAIEETSN